MDELAIKLSNIDEPEKWKAHTIGYSKYDIDVAYKLAMPLWVERMIHAEKLLFHPDVTKDIKTQGFELNDLQSRMAWASVLATDISPHSRDRFRILKEKIIKKHGRDWWKDVFKRKKYAYAARERIRKSNEGAAVSTFNSLTHIGALYAGEKKMRALRGIPKI